MKGAILFALGAASGVFVTAAWLGVRPAEAPEQVTVIVRPPAPPVAGPVAVVPVAPAAEPGAGLQPAAQPASQAAAAAEPIVPSVRPMPSNLQETAPVTAAAAPLSAVLRPDTGTLAIPVYGLKTKQLVDNFNERRGAERHDALDIMAPRGTPVIAVEDGRIAKLFTSKPGGLTIYQFDPTERYAYYYAHLDRYAQGLAEGQQVKKGDVIGFVGSTGNASPNAPHLHFSIFVLGPQKHWWQGTAINPYPLLTAAK